MIGIIIGTTATSILMVGLIVFFFMETLRNYRRGDTEGMLVSLVLLLTLFIVVGSVVHSIEVHRKAQAEQHSLINETTT